MQVLGTWLMAYLYVVLYCVMAVYSTSNAGVRHLVDGLSLCVIVLCNGSLQYQ